MHGAPRPQTELFPDEIRALTRSEGDSEGEADLGALLDTVVPKIAEDRDPFAYVEFHRTVLRLLQENGAALEPPAAPPRPEVLRATRKIDAALNGRAPDPRRPPLIEGDTFEACLGQYDALIGYVGNLWASGCTLFRDGAWPLCAAVSLLAMEEIGRLDRTWYDLLAWDYSVAQVETVDAHPDEQRRRDFVAAVRTALVSPRLRRLFGSAPVERLIADIESGEIERFRRHCLHIETDRGWLTTPAERVDRPTAEFLVVLAGELWAEVLGHFPWKYYEMIERVAEFELAIGLPQERVWDAGR